MTDLEAKVERDNAALRKTIEKQMESLERELTLKLQRALDNPLAN